jgi:hypothetical protein
MAAGKDAVQLNIDPVVNEEGLIGVDVPPEQNACGVIEVGSITTLG